MKRALTFLSLVAAAALVAVGFGFVVASTLSRERTPTAAEQAVILQQQEIEWQMMKYRVPAED